MDFQLVLFALGVMLAISVVACKMSSKLGVPFLLLFLGIGMLAGSDGLGGIEFEDFELTRIIGDLALLFILFDGGLNTKLHDIRPVLKRGLVLSTFGVLLTMLLTGAFAWFSLESYESLGFGVTGITLTEGMLLGAIISSTDAAAVFSILRSSGVKLKNNLQPLLELESGSNDPMAVLLTTAIIGGMTGGKLNVGDIAITLISQLTLGAALGGVFGYVTRKTINRLRLPTDGLYPVFSVAMALLTYTVTTWCYGNGFLAVYIAGIVITNGEPLDRENTITSFHNGLGWLTQVTMFLFLGLLVFPSKLPSVAGAAIVIALFLMFVSRPLGVFICMLGTRRSLNERIFISWVGLRGSVPIILATFPMAAGVKGADSIFNIVFFIVLISVIAQGFTLTSFAKKLGVTESPGARSPWGDG